MSKDEGSSSLEAEERDEGNYNELAQATRCQYYEKMQISHLFMHRQNILTLDTLY